MNIISYRGRTVDTNSKLEVYRCLNRKGRWFSIRQGGLVRAHTTMIKLEQVEFKVNLQGKKRARESGIRNVHATITGWITNKELKDPIGNVSYNPFSLEGFLCNGQPIKESNYIEISEESIKAYSYEESKI